MKIRHLQLNTSVLKHPQKVMDFITKKNVDVACLQEIVYPISKESPMRKLSKKTGYNYEEGVHFYFLPDNKTVAMAILSKWKVIEKTLHYYNTTSYEPKELRKEKLISVNLLDDKKEADFPASRGLKHWVKSRCIINTLIDAPKGLLRVITSHNTVSSLCTETVQMYEMAQMVNSIVKHAKKYPTIYSADLNIRPQSYSVKKISEVMTCHTEDFTDTLAKSHVAKKKDFPEGLAVDHVFSIGLKHLETKLEDVDFSEHKAVLSEFELF
ncbi:hypothetical protein JW766_02420 [Candidatus Dojkabacteria bacterium]|nr:hypothetical protein [Candidatus Dojkabacteria bacterium]